MKKSYQLLIKNIVSGRPASSSLLVVVLANIGDNIAYRHGLHFCCQEVYPNRNQKKV
ncbi:hypothetical protein BH18THE2_BH18THE2_41010 [soil metagenome]